MQPCPHPPAASGPPGVFPWMLLLLLLGSFLRPTTASCGESPEERYRRLYQTEKRRWEQSNTNAEAGWEFARACFDWADLAATDGQRARIAQEGIVAARHAVELEPGSAPARYYLGLNLGQLAQTKLLGALKLLDEMESAWKQSLALDPQFDYAGAHRSLGLLYRDAPGWPASLGDRTKARQHLRKAVALSPDYPDNQLFLLESYLKWGEKKAAADEIPAIEEILKSARTKLSGDAWVLSWRDWDQRWEKIKAKTSVPTATSPRASH